MDKRWRNFAVLAIVFVMAYTVYYFYFSPASTGIPANLEETEKALKKVWSDNNISLANLESKKIALLSDQQLLNVKRELNALKQKLSGKNRDLASLNLKYLEIIQKRRALILGTKNLSNLKESRVCYNLNSFENIKDQAVELSEIVADTEKIALKIKGKTFFDSGKVKQNAEETKTVFLLLSKKCSEVKT